MCVHASYVCDSVCTCVYVCDMTVVIDFLIHSVFRIVLHV